VKQNSFKNLIQQDEGNTFIKIVIATILILFLSNLNALIDLILHPEIPYLDLEHLIVGSITGIFCFIILFLLIIFLKQIGKANHEQKKLINALKIEKDRVQESERKLLQLNTDKDRFISILSHDLKGPFNNILGLSEELTENIRTLDIDKIEYIANIINKSARATFNLLEDILIWARVQQGNISFKPQKLSFSGICKDTLEILNPDANAKSITIYYSTAANLYVFADIDMLKTVLRNLVSNAIKFTNYGGAININAEENSGNITISVSDNGVGIKPEDLTKLFDISKVFTREGTAKETGTGLGLLLCKEFVVKHSGKIWVESEYGKGSKFKFTLPASDSAG
jgi:signal transduction histidine kinase